MAVQRNKIARLPVELRLLVAERLADGKTAEAIRAELVTLGVAEGVIPGRNAFTAYAKGKEYKSQLAELMGWKRKAAEKKQLAEALALGGGVTGVLDLAIWEAAEELRDMLKSGVLEDRADLAKVANALRGLKALTIAEAEQKHKHAAAAKVEKLKGDLAGKKEISLADVSAAMDELVGVK